MDNLAVLTVTVNPALDVAATVEYLVPDHKMDAIDHRRDPGGGGVNVSRVLHRLDVSNRAWVAVGGAVGDELVARSEEEGISTVAHRLDGGTRENLAISDAKTGHQYRIGFPGATIVDPDRAFDEIVDLADGVDIVVLSGGLAPGLPDDFYGSLCKALDAPTTVVDAKGAALAHVVDGPADVVKPSRRELASLVSWIPADFDEVELAARQVLERGSVGALAVSLGGDGAVLVERDGPSTWFDPPAVDVSSTVGAGDSMVAGIVAGLVGGATLAEATRRGVAAGTATATTPAPSCATPPTSSGCSERCGSGSEAAHAGPMPCSVNKPWSHARASSSVKPGSLPTGAGWSCQFRA